MKSGLGGAYRAGFAWGLAHGYDHFVEIDCDFSHDPIALPMLLSAAKDHDVVIGSRYIPAVTSRSGVSLAECSRAAAINMPR